jgi:hypothetical protein
MGLLLLLLFTAVYLGFSKENHRRLFFFHFMIHRGQRDTVLRATCFNYGLRTSVVDGRKTALSDGQTTNPNNKSNPGKRNIF